MSFMNISCIVNMIPENDFKECLSTYCLCLNFLSSSKFSLLNKEVNGNFNI